MQEKLNKELVENIASKLDSTVDQKTMFDTILAFQGLFKAVKLYGKTNSTVLKNQEQLFLKVKQFFLLDTIVEFSTNGFDVFINAQRIRIKKSGEHPFKDFLAIFKLFTIKSIIFSSKITKEELLDFVIFISTQKIDEKTFNFEELKSQIEEKFPPIELIEMFNNNNSGVYAILDKVQMARLTYRNLVENFVLFQSKIKQKRPVPLKKAVRNIQNLIEILSDTSDDSQKNHLLTASSIPVLENNFIATHSANVTVLSVATGIKLNLPKNQLLRLGIASLLHDLGIDEFEIENSVTNHNHKGFAFLSRLNSLNFSMMEAALTADFHHTTHLFDTTIILEESQHRAMSPLIEILKPIDYFELITRRFSFGKTSISKTAGIKQLFKLGKEKKFSLMTIRALFSVLGIYPPGSILKIKNQKLLAFSMGGFDSLKSKGKVARLDRFLNFIDFKTYSPEFLEELEIDSLLELPPKTITIIMNSFK